MYPAQQSILQQWQQKCQEVTWHVSQLLAETEAGCRQMLGAHPTDPIPLQNALQAVHIRVQTMKQQAQEVWSRIIQSPEVLSSGDNRAFMEQGEAQWDGAERVRLR